MKSPRFEEASVATSTTPSPTRMAPPSKGKTATVDPRTYVRREVRWEPAVEKHVNLTAKISARVVNESNGGICLQVPIDADIEMGSLITVADEGEVKVGRVCWTRIDERGPHRIFGMAWQSSDES